MVRGQRQAWVRVAGERGRRWLQPAAATALLNEAKWGGGAARSARGYAGAGGGGNGATFPSFVTGPPGRVVRRQRQAWVRAEGGREEMAAGQAAREVLNKVRTQRASVGPRAQREQCGTEAAVAARCTWPIRREAVACLALRLKWRLSHGHGRPPAQCARPEMKYRFEELSGDRFNRVDNLPIFCFQAVQNQIVSMNWIHQIRINI